MLDVGRTRKCEKAYWPNEATASQTQGQDGIMNDECRIMKGSAVELWISACDELSRVDCGLNAQSRERKRSVTTQFRRAGAVLRMGSLCV